MKIFCNLLFKGRKRKRKCCSHFEVFGVLHGTAHLLFIRVGWDVSVGVLVEICICIGVTCCYIIDGMQSLILFNNLYFFSGL